MAVGFRAAKNSAELKVAAASRWVPIIIKPPIVSVVNHNLTIHFKSAADTTRGFNERPSL